MFRSRSFAHIGSIAMIGGLLAQPTLPGRRQRAHLLLQRCLVARTGSRSCISHSSIAAHMREIPLTCFLKATVINEPSLTGLKVTSTYRRLQNTLASLTSVPPTRSFLEPTCICLTRAADNLKEDDDEVHISSIRVGNSLGRRRMCPCRASICGESIRLRIDRGVSHFED